MARRVVPTGDDEGGPRGASVAGGWIAASAGPPLPSPSPHLPSEADTPAVSEGEEAVGKPLMLTKQQHGGSEGSGHPAGLPPPSPRSGASLGSTGLLASSSPLPSNGKGSSSSGGGSSASAVAAGEAAVQPPAEGGSSSPALTLSAGTSVGRWGNDDAHRRRLAEAHDLVMGLEPRRTLLYLDNGERTHRVGGQQ